MSQDDPTHLKRPDLPALVSECRALGLLVGCLVPSGYFLLALPQQCDFGWRQHPGSVQGSELLIE